MLGPTSGVSSPTPKTRENVRVSMCPEVFLSVYVRKCSYQYMSGNFRISICPEMFVWVYVRKCSCQYMSGNVRINICPEMFVSVYVCPETVYEVQPPPSPDLSPFRFLSVGTNKIHTVFSFNLKWRKISPTHFSCLSEHSQPPRDVSNGMAVNDQKCPRLRWFRWRTFWAIVVVSDLINSYRSSVIKLATCTVKALCQL
jgi:hypothetical protein